MPERAVLHELGEIGGGKRPRIVGIHTKVITVNTTERYIRRLRELGASVIIGGPDGTIRPERYLEAGAEAVVLSEGEATLLELLTHARAGAVPYPQVLGVSFLDGQGNVRRTMERPLLDDLDADLRWLNGRAGAWRENEPGRFEYVERAQVLRMKGHIAAVSAKERARLHG